MAVSEFRHQLLKSVKSDEGRRVVEHFYNMSHAQWLDTHRRNLGKLIESFSRSEPELWDGKEPWAHQKDNIQDRYNKLALETPPPGFITPLPAGAGKSELIIQTVMHNAVTVEDKLITPPTVILVPSEDLAKKAYGELKKRYPNLLVGMDYGKQHSVHPLTISIYDTFIDKLNEGRLAPHDILSLVMDEGHRGLSEARLESFKRFLGIALVDTYSASPAFDASKNLYALLGQESVILSPSDRELTNRGILAECHNVLMRIKVDTKDIPPELIQDQSRYRDFLEELKALSAIEFYFTYADEETGQRALGKPAIAFTPYVKNAQRAKELFQQAFERHAATDESVAQLLRDYSHPTQVLSRSLGDKAVAAAFNRILPLQDRTASEGENLITFTSRMAREGTDVPRWKVALGLQTPNSSVEQIQSRGRARRKIGEELSFVLDTFIEEDGKIKGKPKFYYEAIDDPSIVRGIVTVTPEPGTIKTTIENVLEYKTKAEMQGLVLGSGGSAQRRHEILFVRLWDEVIDHIESQKKRPNPKPYMLDGEPVPFKIIVHYREDEEGVGKTIAKTEIRISQKAVDQFRAALGIPGQINSKWLNSNALKKAVIGIGQRGDHYETAFWGLYNQAAKHYEAHKPPTQAEPFLAAGQPIRMQERLDDYGDLVLAFHADSIAPFKAQLDIAPAKGLRFIGRDEFAERFFAAPIDSAIASIEHPKHDELDQLWERVKTTYQATRVPGQKFLIPIGTQRVEAAVCFAEDGDMAFLIHDEMQARFATGGGLIFCLDRSGVTAARRELGLSVEAVPFDSNTIKWERGITGVEQIIKLRDNTLYDLKGNLRLGKIEIAGALQTGANDEQFRELFRAIETEYDEKEARGVLDEEPICQYGQVIDVKKSRSGSQVPYTYTRDQLPLFARLLDVALVTKTDQWKTRTGIVKGKWITPDNRIFFDEIEKEFLDKRRRGTLEQEPIVRNNKPIQMDLCKVDNNSSAVCYHTSNEQDLIRFSGLSLNVPEKTKQWLDRKEAAVLLGGRSPKTDTFFKSIEEEYKRKEKIGTLEFEPIEREGKILQVERKASSKTSKIVCYHQDSIEDIKTVLGIKTFPKKTKEWRNKKEAAKAVRVHASLHIGFNQTWDEMKSLCDADKSIIIDDRLIKYQKMQSGPNTAYCIHKSEDEWMKERLNRLEELETAKFIPEEHSQVEQPISGVTDGSWSAAQFSEKLGAANRGVGKRLIAALRGKFAATQEGTVEFMGLSVPRDAITEYEAHGIDSYGIQATWGETIAAAYLKAESEKQAVWTVGDIAEASDIGRGTINQILKGLLSQAKGAPNKPITYRGIEIPATAVKQQGRGVKSGKYFGIEAEYGKLLAEVLSTRKLKTNDVWGGSELSDALGKTTGQYVLAQLKKQVDEGAAEVTYQGIIIPADAIVGFENKGRPAVGITKDWGKKIARTLNLEFIDKEEPTKEGPRKKSIDPNSPDIRKRSGRSRGGKED